jgi:WD40 repeat protein
MPVARPAVADGFAARWQVHQTATSHGSAACQRAALTGHTGEVRSVAVSADATTAVSGGFDKTARVWDLAKLAQVARWDGDHPWSGVPGYLADPSRSAWDSTRASHTCSSSTVSRILRLSARNWGHSGG